MGKPVFAPGTKNPDPRVTPSEYTDKQYKALNGLKQLDPPLKYGMARAEFVNKILLPDGTISDDLAGMRAAVAKSDAEDTALFREFQSKHTQAILDDTLSPELRAQYVDLKYWGVHDFVKEVEEHLAQNRFLFVVDAAMTPRIYFQCAVPGNPDMQLAEE